MRVGFEELPDVDVEKMIVVEADETHLIGQCVGYRCQHCGEADETLQQIWHDEEEDCPLVGEHGRQQYDRLDADIEVDSPTPELQEENPIWIIISAETDRGDGVYNGEPVAFRCQCGNADDDLFELVHDDGCALADENCELGRTDVDGVSKVRAVPDGAGF